MTRPCDSCRPAGLLTKSDQHQRKKLMTPICKRCQDTGWVYESHLGRPRSNELPHGFEFVVPCPDCRAHVSQSIRRIKYNYQSMPILAGETMRKTSTRNR